MATVTCFIVVTSALLATSVDAQTGFPGIPTSIVDFINGLTQGNSNQALMSPANSGPSPANTLQPQLSLVESFGPISSSTLGTGTQTGSSPFSQGQSGGGTSQTQTPAPSSSLENVAQFFGGSGGSSGPAVNSGPSVNSGNSVFGNGAGSTTGSEPLGNDILSQVAAFVNQGNSATTSGGSFTPPTSSSGFPQGTSSSGFPQGTSFSGFPQGTSSSGFSQGPSPPNMMNNAFGSLAQAGPPPTMNADYSGLPMGTGGAPMAGPEPGAGMPGMGGSGMPSFPPMSPMGGMMSGMMSDMQNQAMLRVGRRLGRRFGVNQYYEIHGCEDPTQLFTGRQKIMATLAMAQGCHSFRAKQICHMAQVKERIGNSLLTSRILPPQVRSRLEGCLSAKVLFSSMSSQTSPSMGMGMLPSMSMSSGAPSLRECGMLLSTVMDGGSLDPESMISTRRRMLPWSCNESNMGPNNIPYRVCCPGKVMEPTLHEAHMLRGMMNA